MSSLRSRFAPSPTGFLHIGGVRTALFAWLLARRQGGQFILRFEDTDKSREVAGAKDHIIDCLSQLGLDWDEGPDKGGPHAPYVQSERLDIYKKWGQKLIDAGRAYADSYTPNQVEAFRNEAKTAKRPYLYRDYRPDNPKPWDGTSPLRFKADPKAYKWRDIVMGDLSSGPEVIDDVILIKSDGFPTYNFAHIVDDAEMRITHVLRGQEFLASVPTYLNIYEALGISAPQFATMPHVLAAEGNKKLSKRDGAKDVLDYLKQGYLPDALISFIATLGWNDGTKQEIYTKDELIKKFSLERVQRSGGRFDERRLQWINGSLIREMPLEKLFNLAKTYWSSEAENHDEDYRRKVLGVVQERLKYLAEIPELTSFFFIDPPLNPDLISSSKSLKDLARSDLKTWLSASRDSLAASDFSLDDVTKRLNGLLESTGQKPGVLFSLIRIAITQAPSSPGLAETLAVLGKDRTLKRLDAQLDDL
jgi:glutamyl-tRNA synthetase